MPTNNALYQNFPNPFNPTTSIRYDLRRDGHVVVRIYNVAGQEVRTLVDEQQLAGQRKVTWDGRDDYGRAVASGVYVYRIAAGDFVKSRKMILLK